MGTALMAACGKGTGDGPLSSGSAGAGKQKVAPNSAKAKKAIDEEIRYRLNKPTSKLKPEDVDKIEELVIKEKSQRHY